MSGYLHHSIPELIGSDAHSVRITHTQQIWWSYSSPEIPVLEHLQQKL